jgi:2-amino-4-hydroxy-6-hydroxymethyldihydropteridine diphosphokinase
MVVRSCVGLGSNLGDRRAILDRAIDALAGVPGVAVESLSRAIETSPVGGPGGQGPFLNAAAVVETSLEPDAFLEALRAIEREAGRVRRVRWGERTLDLDLLLFGPAVIDRPEMSVPHPRMGVRHFVLEPLAEIAPEMVDPMTGLTIGQLRANLDRRPGVVGLVRGRGAVAASFLETVQRGVPGDWSVEMIERSDLARSTVGPRPVFALMIGAAGPSSRRDLAGRVPFPLLWVAPDDPEAAVAEMRAACQASRPG